MILEVIIIVTSLRSIGCSYVVDSVVQDAVYLSDYCPKSQFCEEGTHIVCMLYNPNQLMGPNCVQARNISINAEVAKFALNVVNFIRNAVAMGNETYGKERTKMPRGYGMREVEWDAELATFAQIKANSCLNNYDRLCTATHKFPNPAQLIGAVRHEYLSYRPFENAKFYKYNIGLSSGALSEAMMTVFKSIYITKINVTSSMLEKYPKRPADDIVIPRYLTLIQGDMTHMGCGLSASLQMSGSQMSHNIIVACYFSKTPEEGKPVYNMKVPGPGENKCGCPKGLVENPRCLCRKISAPVKDVPGKPKTCENEGNCEPTVVLLPIIAMRDAPHDMLCEDKMILQDVLKKFMDNKKNYFINNNPLRSSNPLDILINMNETERMQYIAPYVPHYKELMNKQFPIVHKSQKNPSSVPKVATSKNPQNLLEFLQQPNIPFPLEVNEMSTLNPDDIDMPVFPTHFNENHDKSHTQPDGVHEETRSKGLSIKHLTNLLQEHITNDREKTKSDVYDDSLGDNTLHTHEESTFDRHLRTNNSIDEKDNELMTILNILEREVKHTNFKTTDIEKIDAKIKQIYREVNSKPDELSSENERKVNQIKRHSKLHTRDQHKIPKEIDDYDNFNDDHKKFIDQNNKAYRVSSKYTRHNSLEEVRLRKFDEESKLNYPDVEKRPYYKMNEDAKTAAEDDRKNRIYTHNQKYYDEDSLERRKYYQNKLNNIQKRINRRKMRPNRPEIAEFKNSASKWHLPKIRPNRKQRDMQRRGKSENQIDALYMPDRARYLHGF